MWISYLSDCFVLAALLSEFLHFFSIVSSNIFVFRDEMCLTKFVNRNNENIKMSSKQSVLIQTFTCFKHNSAFNRSFYHLQTAFNC